MRVAAVSGAVIKWQHFVISCCRVFSLKNFFQFTGKFFSSIYFSRAFLHPPTLNFFSLFPKFSEKSSEKEH